MKVGEFETDCIYNVDCYEAIKKLPDKSIDLIVTDPPYKLGGGLAQVELHFIKIERQHIWMI